MTGSDIFFLSQQKSMYPTKTNQVPGLPSPYQKNISKEPVNEQVFKLWFDHGGRPTKAGYQYIVVPDVDQSKLMETSQNNRSIKILSNTDSVQAVLHGKLNILQAAFYQAAELKVTPTFSLKMDSQGMAMVKMDGSRIKTICVADPSRQLSRMSITVSGIYAVKKEGLVCLAQQPVATNHTAHRPSTRGVCR